MEDDSNKSPTQEELETILRAAGVGAGATATRTGGCPVRPDTRVVFPQQFADHDALMAMTETSIVAVPLGRKLLCLQKHSTLFSVAVQGACLWIVDVLTRLSGGANQQVACSDSTIDYEFPLPTCCILPGAAPSIPGRGLSERQSRDIGALLSLPSLQPLASHMSAFPEEWCRVLDENDAEKFLPATGWTVEDISKERRAFLAMAVVHALRPDRTMAAAEELVEKVFSGGEEVLEGGDEAETGLPWNEALDLEASVKEGPGPEAPVLLCSEAGHDASWKVLLCSWLWFRRTSCCRFQLRVLLARMACKGLATAGTPSTRGRRSSNCQNITHASCLAAFSMTMFVAGPRLMRWRGRCRGPCSLCPWDLPKGSTWPIGLCIWPPSKGTCSEISMDDLLWSVHREFFVWWFDCSASGNVSICS